MLDVPPAGVAEHADVGGAAGSRARPVDVERHEEEARGPFALQHGDPVGPADGDDDVRIVVAGLRRDRSPREPLLPALVEPGVQRDRRRAGRPGRAHRRAFEPVAQLAGGGAVTRPGLRVPDRFAGVVPLGAEPAPALHFLRRLAQDAADEQRCEDEDGGQRGGERAPLAAQAVHQRRQHDEHRQAQVDEDAGDADQAADQDAAQQERSEAGEDDPDRPLLPAGVAPVQPEHDPRREQGADRREAETHAGAGGEAAAGRDHAEGDDQPDEGAGRREPVRVRDGRHAGHAAAGIHRGRHVKFARLHHNVSGSEVLLLPPG